MKIYIIKVLCDRVKCLMLNDNTRNKKKKRKKNN